MRTQQPHIVSAYGSELKRLKAGIVQMAGAAETQLDQAIACLAQRNPELVRAIVASDERLDNFEQEIEASCMRLLVLRQPVADDLREVIGALKISGNLERVGDHAANSARRATRLVTMGANTAHLNGLPALGRLVRSRLSTAINAYAERDVEMALEVWCSDDEVDALYSSLSESIIASAEANSGLFAEHMHLQLIAKSLERIGDHATNIAEVVHFVATGRPLLNDRPRADRSRGSSEL